MTDPSAAPSLARSSPAALRNRAPIRDALRRVLPPHGTVLEIGSGTGEHITFFAAAFPGLTWQPSDPDGSAIDSINAHAARRNLPNLRMPVRLDAAGDDWPHAQFDAILASNVVHIAPWAVTEGLMAGAARGLSVGGLLFLYGPYMIGGTHTVPSNADFDASLRARNPAWGIRDRDAVARAAAANGLTLVESIAMPANNLALVFRPGLQRARIRGPRQAAARPTA